MEKMTYVEALDFVLDDSFVLPDEVREKLSKLREQQGKRKVSGKALAKQEQNSKESEVLLAFLANSEPLTVSEILRTCPDFSVLTTSSQHITYLLHQLVKENKVKREMVKGSAKFSIA